MGRIPQYITPESSSGIKLTAAVSYYLTMMSLGFLGSIYGVILPYLIEKTNSGTSEISYLFLFQGSGFILASLLFGRFFDTVPGNRLLAFIVFGLVGCMYFIDKIDRIWMICLLSFVFGICVCMINIGVNTLIERLYGSKMGPYLNVVHVFYAIGCIVTPLLVANAFQSGDELGVALRILLVIMTFIGCFVFLTPGPEPITAERMKQKKEKNNFSTVFPAVLLGMFLFFSLGGQTTCYNWYPSSVLHLFKTTEAEAARFPSIFWIGILLGRITSSKMVRNSNVFKYMLYSMSGCVLFSAALMFWKSIYLSAVLFFLVGFGIGPIYANAFVYFHNKSEMSGQMNGVIFAVYQLGIMFFPWFTGQLIEIAGYGIPVVIITCAFLCSIPFLLLLEFKIKKA